MLHKHGLDRQAVNDRIERLRPSLFAKALQKLGDVVEAEDVVQDTCTLAWEHLGDLRGPEHFGGWVFAILRNAIFHRYRVRANQQRVFSLNEEDGVRVTPAPPDQTQLWESQHHAKILIERLVERLPPVLAEYVRATIREGYEQEAAAGPARDDKHKLRRNQERLKEWIWKAVGMETELAFLRRVDDFVSCPCPQTSTALLAAAKEEAQLNFAHVVLTLYHVGIAEGLSNSLAWHREEASHIVQAARSVADGVLRHANLALQSADVIRDPYFQGTAHELMAEALFGQIECWDDGPEVPGMDEITLSLKASAEKWGTAAAFYAEAEGIEAMTQSCLCQAIILKNIGHKPQARQVLEEAWRICSRYAYRACTEIVSREMSDLSTSGLEYEATDREASVSR